MTGPQFFGALVRAIGIYWFTYGLITLAGSITPAEGNTYVVYILMTPVYLIIGAFLMFKADPIIEMCYAKTDRDGYPISSDVKASDDQ